jgi:hypothetical protein
MFKVTLINIVIFLLLLGCAKNKTELANEAPLGRNCSAAHQLVGQSRSLSSLQHGVSGVVTIVSDCEIRIDNFNYDGGGPNVRIYGAKNGNFSSGFNLTEKLNGKVYSNDTISFFIPEGKTLDDIDSFSVWCFEFNVNFGSTVF